MMNKRKKIGGGFIPDLEEYERENQIKPKKKRRGFWSLKKAFDSKIETVSKFISSCYPKVVIDLGANDGVFAELASIDPNAVNKIFNQLRRNKK